MSAAELKKSIIEKLNVVNDEEFLAAVHSFLVINEEDKEIYNLSEEQLKAVNEGLEEYKAGKGISNEEVEKKFDEWLGK